MPTVAATTTTLTTFQKAGAIWLALYAARDYITGGSVVVHGDPNHENNFFKLIPCTVDEFGEVSIPSYFIEPTETSSDPTVTIDAFFLDLNLHKIQRFLYSFRVPAYPPSTAWAGLMSNMTIPQLIIDPEWTRTQNVLQMWDEDHGIVDSIAAQDGTAIEITGSLSTTLGISSGAGVAAVGALSGASLAIAGSGSFGNDIAVADDGVFVGDVHAAHFYGDMSTATGLPSDTMVGNTWTGIASLGVNYDSDANGSGEFSIARGGVNRLLIDNAGLATFYNGILGALMDKGGERFNVKAYGAKGDGVTDDTAAINAAIAAGVATGRGFCLFFPPGEYLTTGGHVLFSSMTVEGATGGYPAGFPFSDVTQLLGGAVIHLTDENAHVFFIGERTVGITIHDLGGVADSVVGTKFIYCEGDNPAAPEDPPASSFGHSFQRLYTVGFRSGIEIQTTTPGASWQCDRSNVDHCAFIGTYSLYFNSPDADHWLVTNTTLGAHEDGYGFYGQRCGPVTFDTCYGVGNAAQIMRSLFYFTPEHDLVSINNCWTENSHYFLELQDSVNTATSAAFNIKSSGITAAYLGHSCRIVSSGNTYVGEGCVTVGADSGNNVISSVGDSVVIGGGIPTVIDASPFNLIVPGLGTVGGSVLTELGRYINHIETRYSSNGFSVGGHVGLGETPALTTATLSIMQTASESSGGTVPFIRMMESSGTHKYDITRGTAGALLFRGSQTGSVGYSFDGWLAPSADNQFALGFASFRWSDVRATVVHEGDAFLCDRETGEELYKLHEDRDRGIFFDDARTGERLMRLARDGHMHLKGGVVPFSSDLM